MKFSKKILETFVSLPDDWRDLMEDLGLEVKSLDGDVMNLELLANRGDHYCYMGLAREIAARTGGAIAIPESVPLDAAAPSSFAIETDKCIAYSMLRLVLSGPQDAARAAPYIGQLLQTSGINVIHPAIDVTNVILLELGQPAHAYDADKIRGVVRIRESAPGEKAALLFHEGETELPAGTCVVADDEKILCIGGVIGCRGAEVDAGTTNVLLEAALFDPVSIRRTERALLSSPTLAAQIFERGGNLSAIRAGAERAARLYRDIGWVPSGGFQFAQKVPLAKKEISLPGDFVRAELEMDIPDDEIASRLARCGFALKDGKYVVPPARIWDIAGEPADLIEELARCIGYNNLPSRLPPAGIGAAPSMAETRRAEIDSYLVHCGFYEVFTDGMYSPKHAAAAPDGAHVGLENSVDGGYAFMRNNTIVQAAELAARNLRVKNSEIRVFEWAKVFTKGDKEREVLWGLMNGAKESALTAKGVVENLGRALGLGLRLEYRDCPAAGRDYDRWMPKRRAAVFAGGDCVGCFGEISPELLSAWDIKNDAPVYFAFDAEKLLKAPVAPVEYQSPPATIPSARDISVAVPYGRAAGDVADFIIEKYPDVAKAVISDVYDKPKERARSITFALEFSGARSAESMNALILDIMAGAAEFASR